ncbi:MAG: hypothetical protein U0271_38125 [Polyangiaceae bacterium]
MKVAHRFDLAELRARLSAGCARAGLRQRKSRRPGSAAREPHRDASGARRDTLPAPREALVRELGLLAERMRALTASPTRRSTREHAASLEIVERALVTWGRERDFPSAGRRPADPERVAR